ncbi:10063_t:CDS:2, partial [Gigaspora margarita]
MKKIYKVVNDSLKFLNEDKIREFKLQDKKLFLNSDNPFDPNCWVLGKMLVFALGAEEVDNNIRIYEILINYSPSDYLIKYFIKCLQSQNSYYDVIFKIGDHKICANRFVLS